LRFAQRNSHPEERHVSATTGTIARRLAGFVSDLTLEQVPDETRQRARLLLLDAIGAALAAAAFDFGRSAVRGLATLGPGTANVIGFRERLVLSAGEAERLRETVLNIEALPDAKRLADMLSPK